MTLDRTEAIYAILVAIMLFIVIAMIMIGLGEYPKGRTWPGPTHPSLYYSPMERAGVVHHTPSTRWPSHQKESLWK